MRHACLLYIGTEDGVLVFHVSGGEMELIGRGLEGHAVRAIALHPEDSRIAYVACGLRGWGLYRTLDAGRHWDLLGFKDRWVWDVVFHPNDPQTIFIGTEPPMLYISRDGGQTFEAFEGIDRLPSRRSWKFFYEPFYAGHIHGITLHPRQPQRLFAGVEQGALIYSHDGGRTWHEALVGHDLHRIAIDPSDPDRIFAGAGEGLFVSEDAARTWIPVAHLEGKYVHGIYFDPHHPERMYTYVAKDPAPLYKSEDGGRNWHPMARELPENGSADSFSLHPECPELLFYGGEVGGRRGQLFASWDAGEHWEMLGGQLPKIWRLRVGKPVERTGTQYGNGRGA